MSHRTPNSTNQVLPDVYTKLGTALHLTHKVAADKRSHTNHSIPHRALANLYTYNVNDEPNGDT